MSASRAVARAVPAAIAVASLLGALPSLLVSQVQPAPTPGAKPTEGQSSQRCVLEIENVDRQGRQVQTPEGTNYFAGGNVRLRCKGTTITMRSDSVAAYGGNVIQFIGNVKYRDSALTMDADRGTYYRNGERWEARGRVVTNNLVTGSKLTGPMLDYFREVRGVRDTSEMFAKQRPRIEYVTTDSAGKRAEPYIIVADRVRFKGNTQIWAGGTVTIDRSDFTARGDSLKLDTGKGSAGTLLGGKPELRGTRSDTFNLHGRRIDFNLDNRALTYMVAKGAARAVSKDWDLVADTIALDVNDNIVEQTFAWGKDSATGQPSATSSTYEIKADSLAFDTPKQKLQEIRSFGAAWLGGDSDSASGERDWMRGDTVLAKFEQRDSAGKARTVLSRIESRHDARSYYADRKPKSPGRPAINYVRGDRITVIMRPGNERGVAMVEVHGQVDGVHLDPSIAPAPIDSARADTTPRAPRGGPP